MKQATAAFLKGNYYLLFFLLYLASLLISKFLGIYFFQEIFVLPVLLFFPGFVVWKALCRKLPIAAPYNYLLSLPFSLGILSAGILMMSKSVYQHTPFNTSALVVGISILMIILDFAFNANQEKEKRLFKLADLLPAAGILLLLCLIWITYRFFPGDDTYGLAGSIRQSIETGNITQAVLERRPLFTPLVIVLYYSGKLSIFFILKYLIPLISFLAVITPIGILKESKKSGWLQLCIMLLFLASPYLVFSLSYAIPQSFLIIFLVPALVLSVYGLSKDRVDLIVAAFFLSFLSTAYHELSFLLLAVSLFAIVVYLVRQFFRIGWGLLKYIFLGILLILPYAIIFQIFAKITSFFSVLTYASGGVANHFAPRLWYVNYYLNPDGIVFSYKGLSGLSWYAYLGALAFFALLTFAIYLYKNKARLSRDLHWIDYSPLIIFTAIFAFVSEIYPRLFTIAFLPERAWVFMILGLWLFVIMVAAEFNLDGLEKSFFGRALIVFNLLVILSGIGASIYLNINRSIMMSPGDVASVKYINDFSPETSIILSTQVHETGPVSIAGRSYIHVTSPESHITFSQFREDALLDYQLALKDYQAEKDEIIYGLFGDQLSIKKTKLIHDPDEIKNAPVYFIYSKERLANTKFVGNPNYFKQNDKDNQDLYFSEDYLREAVYCDQSVVIFRLK